MVVIDGVDMVDVREAAALVHRTPETVRRWIWSGQLGATKRSNRLLIERRALLQFAGLAGLDAPYSLMDWADEVAATHPRGQRRATARDLVLDDRAARDTDARR
jgi:hypothetical protein